MDNPVYRLLPSEQVWHAPGVQSVKRTMKKAAIIIRRFSCGSDSTHAAVDASAVGANDDWLHA